MQALKHLILLTLIVIHIPAFASADCDFTPPPGYILSESKKQKSAYVNKDQSAVLVYSCISNITSAEAEKTLQLFPQITRINYKIAYQDLKSKPGFIARMYFKTGPQFTQVSVVGKYKTENELKKLQDSVVSSLENGN